MPIQDRANLFPEISREEIVRQADLLDRAYREIAGARAVLGTRFDHVYEQVIYPKYEIGLVEHIDLGVDEQGAKIFGYFDPRENVAYIDVSLRNDPRREFTCWHEVGGHGILQGAWLRSFFPAGNKVVVTTEASLDPATTAGLEWQANTFAAYGAAPSWYLNHAFTSIFRSPRPFVYSGPGNYDFEAKFGTKTHWISDFGKLCYQIACYIQRYFGLSKEALGYRIEDSILAIDQTAPAKPFILYRKAKVPSSAMRVGA